jgi:hypothetical protein
MMLEFYADDTRDESLEALGMELLAPSDNARAIVYLTTDDSTQITGANLSVGLGIP